MINLKQVIDLINPIQVIGDIDISIRNAIQLNVENEHKDVIMWVSEKKMDYLDKIKSGIIICPYSTDLQLNNPHCTFLLCSNPRLSFQMVLSNFFVQKIEPSISITSIIDPSVKLGENIFIGHNVVIEAETLIGNNVLINHNTVIKKGTIIGNDVVIGSNCVIGGVGFGYEKDDNGAYVFIPHLGNVVIKDKVEVGNNTCIDRGVLGPTLLEENVKVDNLVHIAHGVIIGKNSLIIANAMIAGSVDIGQNVWVAPSSSILNGLSVKSNSTIGLGAVVVKNVEENKVIVGNPGRVLDRGI